MGPLRRPRADHDPGREPADPTQIFPAGHAHDPSPARASDSYRWWALVGAASPFALAALLYPLASVPVGALFPVLALPAAATGALLFGGAAADAPPTGSALWEVGPSVGAEAALTALVAFVLARFVCRRVAAAGGRLPDATPAQRGFAAGSRVAVALAFLLAVWWAGGALLTGGRP